ncbi:tyramine/octopamine receptor-like isoform X1 [Neocloeon triangulifer]|uniref:tyramine/octopamine receptor-like isoform X1 n=1 Tax=Neocloeon triangulifer TaxID=2078957 RepID=UPI00286F14C8|nr:tyramine/octopamine receptor-like isoform X1 [Neocloeon triangulifer]
MGGPYLAEFEPTEVFADLPRTLNGPGTIAVPLSVLLPFIESISWKRLNNLGKMERKIDSGDITIFTACLIIALAILFGNGMTILAIVKKRKLKTASNQFILGLAVADLLVAVSMPYNTVISILYNDVKLETYSDFVYSCLFSLVPVILSTVASNLNLLLIGLDRFLSISAPITHRNFVTIRKARLFVGCTFLLSIIAAALLIFWNNWPEQRTGNCEILTITFNFFLYVLLPSYLSAVILILICYTRIFIVARSRARNANKPLKVNKWFPSSPVATAFVGFL